MTDGPERIALITGADQGVGLQVAKELVAAGVTVLLGSRDLAMGEAAAAGIGPGAIPLRIDVTNGASIEAAAGVLAVYQAMLPLLRPGRDARIVNVSSGVGSLTANADPGYGYCACYSPIYPASKAALNAVTLAIMIELETTGTFTRWPDVAIPW